MNFKRGDWVKVTRRSEKYNPHINNVGNVGRIDELSDEAAQICTSCGGVGAVDIGAIVPYEPTLDDQTKFNSWNTGFSVDED